MTRSGADADAPCPEESSCSAARCQRWSSVKHIWKSFSHGHSRTQLVLRAVVELSSNWGKGLTVSYVCSNIEHLGFSESFCSCPLFAHLYFKVPLSSILRIPPEGGQDLSLDLFSQNNHDKTKQIAVFPNRGYSIITHLETKWRADVWIKGKWLFSWLLSTLFLTVESCLCQEMTPRLSHTDGWDDANDSARHGWLRFRR